MKKILTVFLMVITVSVFAQTQNITGKITDSAGEPLPGVTIVVKGTTTGTITDIDGNYTLPNVSGENTLVFSFVGMITQEITVGTQTTIPVTLVADAVGLDEVVVIGYGTIRKKDLTGSVSTVDTKEAYVAPTASLNTALQGKATGVQVSTSSGAPGSGASIIIRGGNSITAGNEPLYVIDGFVGAGTLSSINPNDIESMQVLKDASSTAIYGARGANGVILITTKKGRIGKPVVSLKSSYGIQVLPEKVDVQSGSEFAAWVNSMAADQSNLPFDLNNLPGKETDWQDVMIEPAPIQDHQLSLSGGTESTTYFISAGYLSQEGIVKTSSFDRYSLRSNIDTKLSEIFSAGLNLSLSKTYSDNNSIKFIDMMQADPLMPAYDEDGNYNGEVYGVSNVQNNLLADNVLNTDDTFKDRALINTYIQAKMFDNITWKSTFGGDFVWTKNHNFIPSTNPTSIRSGLLGQADIIRSNSTVLLNENTIDYKETFGDHSFSVLGGVTFQTQNSETVNISADEIPSDGVGVNSVELAPVENTSISSNYSEYALFSLLGRVNYSYQGKYLLTATVRRDGSSRLGENNRYAVFPSVAMAWNVSDEPFLKDNNTINVLKVRGSFGVTGNQGVSPFSTLSSFTTLNTAAILNGTIVAGVRQGTLANPNLKWELTSQYDLGFEIGLFERRLSAEVDLYYKETKDLLLAAEVPEHTGFTTTIQNVGSLKNKGIDFSLNGVIIDNRDFQWTASLNISAFKNEVIDLGNKSFITTASMNGDPCAQLRVGESVGTFWGYLYESIDPATGDAIYTDISGPDGVPDGSINSEYDKTVIGSANPDFYGGLHTSIKYKNFDMNMFLPFSYGNQNFNNQAFWAAEVNINSLSSLRDNMWTAENPDNASFAGVNSTTMIKSSDFYLMDASYIRLGTLQFGYTLPKNLVKGISNCRFYVTGTNLVLIKDKDYWGFDPDVSSFGGSTTKQGFDNYAYPQNRSFIVGLDITF